MGIDLDFVNEDFCGRTQVVISIPKFLDYINCIDEIVRSIETEVMGKLKIVSEGFHKMDSIVDVYLLTYECSYYGRKNPRGNYQEGDYDTLDLKGNLVKIIDFD